MKNVRGATRVLVVALLAKDDKKRIIRLYFNAEPQYAQPTLPEDRCQTVIYGLKRATGQDGTWKTYCGA